MIDWNKETKKSIEKTENFYKKQYIVNKQILNNILKYKKNNISPTMRQKILNAQIITPDIALFVNLGLTNKYKLQKFLQHYGKEIKAVVFHKNPKCEEYNSIGTKNKHAYMTVDSIVKMNLPLVLLMQLLSQFDNFEYNPKLIKIPLDKNTYLSLREHMIMYSVKRKEPLKDSYNTASILNKNVALLYTKGQDGKYTSKKIFNSHFFLQMSIDKYYEEIKNKMYLGPSVFNAYFYYYPINGSVYDVEHVKEQYFNGIERKFIMEIFQKSALIGMQAILNDIKARINSLTPDFLKQIEKAYKISEEILEGVELFRVIKPLYKKKIDLKSFSYEIIPVIYNNDIKFVIDKEEHKATPHLRMEIHHDVIITFNLPIEKYRIDKIINRIFHLPFKKLKSYNSTSYKFERMPISINLLDFTDKNGKVDWEKVSKTYIHKTYKQLIYRDISDIINEAKKQNINIGYEASAFLQKNKEI